MIDWLRRKLNYSCTRFSTGTIHIQFRIGRRHIAVTISHPSEVRGELEEIE